MNRAVLCLVLLLSGCLRSELIVSHPVTGAAIEVVSLDPITNQTEYDDIPFELESRVRDALQQRYHLHLSSDKPDVQLKLTFVLFRRGSLSRQQDNSSKTLLAIATLEMFDSNGKSLGLTRQQRSEQYNDTSLFAFDEARTILIKRLADQLVVDLLEP